MRGYRPIPEAPHPPSTRVLTPEAADTRWAEQKSNRRGGWRDGHLAPVDLHLHRGAAERQEELARVTPAGIVWLAAKILRWIRSLPPPSTRQTWTCPVGTSWSLTVWQLALREAAPGA